ncbi:rare lipoprotein A [Nitrosomonas aestuarii]|uniref:Endolytic peptidoglycan transglycosylase RlpA n=1 Tax=Nitrosomonas aestuarii TaxID=52441 RepID=A0A1I4GGX7_9PROT|nr:septal ring lytic transglycosylase RlpA family protein [Nitrosomonas aestuarii]SFL29298.1 rare lipoprotein A [Nitrosomonas aestuarii]
MIISSVRQELIQFTLLPRSAIGFRRFSLTILLVVFTSLFVGCTTPFRAPVPTTIPSKTTSIHKPSPAAPYNRTYTVKGKTYYPMRSAVGYSEKGIASWYGSESGNRTAMGVRFNPHELTAAHKTLPLPTKVRVTNLRNGRSVDVIVNDRGPFKRNRIIDLSHGAAKKIGLDKHGLAEVRVEYLDTLASNP